MNALRASRFFATLALAIGCLLVFAGAASAQPGYGSDGPSVSLSASESGGTITATGTGFGSGNSVTGTLFSDPIDLGTKSANDDGKVSFTFSVDGLDAGEHKVVLSSSEGSASAKFTVSGGGEISVVPSAFSVPTAPAGSSDSSGLAFTGSDSIVPVSIVGGLLILGGAAAVVGSRRKSKTRV